MSIKGPYQLNFEGTERNADVKKNSSKNASKYESETRIRSSVTIKCVAQAIMGVMKMVIKLYKIYI